MTSLSGSVKSRRAVDVAELASGCRERTTGTHIYSEFARLRFAPVVNNILDKDPPIVTSEITAGGANNTYETYDTLGRQLFLALTAKF